MQETRLKRNYRELVLTGGPSAGKTSTLAYLREELSERGVRVIFRPEVATMLIQGGITDIDRLAGEQRERYFELQRAILLLEHDMRAHYRRLAAAFRSPAWPPRR